ncbi:MAG: HEAT repeat domain-containing protein [Candidatus Obscuribacterales bacterium]|nr:HEAT repeat domain-containing protein [Candidatus Obscuribacterales bacterium]
MSRISMSGNGALAALLALSFSVLCTSSAFAGDYREADVQAALKQLGSLDKYERKSAAFHLTEMGPAAVIAIPALIEVLQRDESMQVRGEVAHALGNIGPAASAAVPALITFLQSEEGGYERTYAASALGDIGKMPEQAVPALINALQHDQEPVVKQLAARALGDFGAGAASAVPALVDSIKNGDKDLRTAAACGLETIPAPQSEVAEITKLLSDEIDSARLAAAKSLAGLGPEAGTAVPALCALLADKNTSVKIAAINALGAIGPDAKSALPELKKLLKDAEVGGEAGAAINRIKGH